ncbi:MAG: hypothetical protein WA156_11990 [Methylocystis silviterrae]
MTRFLRQPDPLGDVLVALRGCSDRPLSLAGRLGGRGEEPEDCGVAPKKNAAAQD